MASLKHAQSRAVEDLLAFQLTAYQVPYERNFRIHPERRFAADFYLRAPALVVEVDGGGFVQGRHSRGQGIENDCEKSALIACLPARLMRVTPRQVRSGNAVQWILRACNAPALK